MLETLVGSEMGGAGVQNRSVEQRECARFDNPAAPTSGPAIQAGVGAGASERAAQTPCGVDDAAYGVLVDQAALTLSCHPDHEVHERCLVARRAWITRHAELHDERICLKM
ncbi:hypothetical protein GCM10023193_51270 [Planotetraspora kaengkrachanensis]|uniref:Uncharacterized protein n=1 Tax=Planotetraspora kaengkrachanensis TaxID=575193 RepID=A0A8J3M5D9_9ACTN|nr:hypothetical protein Pka01_26780 [Planotetraspora kaengkrachanensis]